MIIEPLLPSDLPAITHLQPPDWADIMPRMAYFTQADFCVPVKLWDGKHIAGIGVGIINGAGSAWLANIIVDEQYRGRGYGGMITRYLADLLHHKGCRSILLLATAMGEPLYRKLGFKEELSYHFMRGPRLETADQEHIITGAAYATEILAMDRQISGEDRTCMIESHIAGAVVYLHNKHIEGYCLPGFGEEPVMAVTDRAGISLLRYKHSLKACITVLPEQNNTGLSFLQQQGFVSYRQAIRMWKGEPLRWQPEYVFSRTGGHYG